MLNTNKEIYRLDLAVTTSCILRCRYCFVKKTNQEMNYKTAKSAIELLISSPGKNKLLIVYGGEPLIYFDLLKKTVIFAKKRARMLNKKIIISLGTNGILFEKEYAVFLKKYNVKISISMDGNRISHNKNRRFKNGRGTFHAITHKLPLIFENVAQENICVLFGVDSKNARTMFENFVYLNKIGFDSINIEPIQGIRWTRKGVQNFLINLEKVLTYILGNIRKKRFIFLNSINRELNHRMLSRLNRGKCPFYQDIEVYPEGLMAFSPFLLNIPNYNKYLIGNMQKGFFDKFKGCQYELDNPLCRNCLQDYYDGVDMSVFDCRPLSLRDRYSVKVAEFINKMSDRESVFKEYIREAKKRIFE